MVAFIMGCCRSNKLHLMKLDYCQDLGEAMLVTITNKKKYFVRKFANTDTYCQKVKKLY